MRFFLQMILIAALGWASGLVMPWWGVAIAGCLGGLLLGGKNFRDFMAGFLAIATLWTMMCLLVLSGTGSPLPDRMAQTISPALDGTLLGLLTGILGGLLGALGSMTGGQFRKIFSKSR
jgi:hypothetical protein